MADKRSLMEAGCNCHNELLEADAFAKAMEKCNSNEDGTVKVSHI